MSEPTTIEELRIQIAIDLFCLVKALEEDMDRCAINAENALSKSDREGWKARELGVENGLTRVREVAVDYLPAEALNKIR